MRVGKGQRVGKALGVLWLWGSLTACGSSAVTHELVQEEEPLVLPSLAGETQDWRQWQCRAGQRFASRYVDETRHKLAVRYQGQEEILHQHVNHDLVIFEGKQLALYSDGHTRQLAHPQTGALLADSCR